MTAKDKVASLREEMKKNNIDAFIVYSADPHMSEYLPEEWQERTWVSGFTGSAGFVVITSQKAGLWTDGRYFTQAPIELKGSGIDLFKDGIEGTPNYIDWIISETSENAKIGVNAFACSHANWELLQTKLENKARELVDKPLLEEVWKDRPMPSKNPIFAHPLQFAGQTVVDKLRDIRQKMKEENASSHIIASLDDVAWTLNLRGSDVDCNPVFLGYIFISIEKAILFVDLDKLGAEAKQMLQESGVSLQDYETFFAYLKTVKGESILLSPNSNQAIYKALQTANKILQKPVPGNLMKAIKNDAELEGFRTVMLRDGVAMVKFLHWLTHTAGKQPLDEHQIGEVLLNFRKEGKDFVGASFGSIIGYKGNGAIIHYSAPAEGSAKVTNQASILVDSGGQYLDGTTDITRTFALGEVSDAFIEDATRVLQGMIRLSMAKFPKGTCGVHLDILARQSIWEAGKDYNHGTGHGVGSFMNVHEGPQSIRKDLNPVVLAPGMVLSNEPGYYVEGEYGIRHENLIVVKDWKKTEWNSFYEFETLTYCPFFTNIIKKDMLSKEEISWLNQYHRDCKEKLAPYLEGEVKDWFLSLVKPI